MKRVQLRDYAIAPGQFDEFVRRWTSGVRPLREAKGFVIEGAWRIPDEERFIWIMSYDGPDGWEAADRAYYASPERKALSPDPAELIVGQRTAFMEPA